MKTGLFCILGYLIGFSFTAPAQSCFTVSSLHSDSTTNSVCTADFNKDGNDDIAIGNQFSSSVSVFLGNGSGGFSAATHFTSSGNDPRGITAADFNGDSIPDIAVANFYTYDIAVMFGTGTGAFGPATSHLIGGPGSGYVCRAITSADLNGDGKMDIATAGDAYVIAVFLNTGSGNFSSATHYLLSANSGPHDIIAVDINHDGILDLATANGGSNDAAVLLGTGSGTFGAATYFATGQNSNGICSADLNEDGNVDLITANPGSSDVSVLLGTGLGTFSTAVNYTVGMNPSYVTAADFDQECNIDVAVTIGGVPCGIALLKGNGTGTFSAPVFFPIPNSPWQVSKADFDKDGRMDIATPMGQDVGLLLNCSSGPCSVSVKEVAKNNISVYPNPAIDQLTVRLNINTEKAKVIIQNMLGQTVGSYSYSHFINVSALTPGLYSLKVLMENGEIYQAKFLKQ